ncbi:MAG: ZPR1 zinc finger domain-containing protein [Desulfurococcaceae archaeon]
MSELRKIMEYGSTCPVCGSSLQISEYIYNIPYYGDVIISTGLCQRCGFRHNDVQLMETKKPRKIVYIVEKPGDENAIVIRNAHSEIEIPELGLSIMPGTYSQGYITTVEGIIEDFLEITKFICNQSDVNKERCEEILNKLEKAKDGLIRYSVVIYDHAGLSDVVSNKTIYYEDIETRRNTNT